MFSLVAIEIRHISDSVFKLILPLLMNFETTYLRAFKNLRFHERYDDRSFYRNGSNSKSR